jgi:hypothetical protein
LTSLFFEFSTEIELMMKYRPLVLSLFLIFLCLALGCGPSGKGLKVEYVEGVLTLDGTPTAGVFVTFVPAEKDAGLEAAGGLTDANGLYKLTSINGDIDKGALAGKYKVTVSKISTEDFLNEDGTYKPGAPKDSSGQLMATKETQLMPKQYLTAKSSPLEVTVESGVKNTMNLELKGN